ncbi:MAG: hypothetical protein G8237_08400 [Magnetococcales bacterium]|nr:hypothetical protein [Magnetococcales bacterium]
MRKRYAFVKFIMVFMLFFYLAACAQVKVYKDNDVVEEYSVWFVKTIPSDFHALALARQGFGVFVSGNEFVVGALDEKRIYVQDMESCKVITFVEDERQLDAIQKQLCAMNHSLGEICIVSHQTRRKKCP